MLRPLVLLLAIGLTASLAPSAPKPELTRIGSVEFRGPVEKMSLRDTLDSHPILKQFVPVASKENGIDIEGLAVKNGRLYFGFRGPVLRDNWVPVLSCTFGKVPGDVKMAYMQLAGRGV